MKAEVAMCQIRPVPGRPDMNAERVVSMLSSEDADVLVFPESFLTGYGTGPRDVQEQVSSAVVEISDLCRKLDKAVALGTAYMSQDGPTNSLAFLSPDGDNWYDKAHLARFGVYAEEGFVPGRKPAMGSYHGLKFGLSICYDAYFPEVMHGYSLRRADVNLCVAAAATPSAPYFGKILPARALENVTYLAFVNNVGAMAGLTMAGGSKAYGPLGDLVAECPDDSEAVSRFTVDTEELARAREVRRHLADFRRDVDWLGQSY